MNYLEESNVPLSKWARSHFTRCRYNIMTTNGAESINAVMKEPREYPIIALLEAMQAKVSEWFNNRHNVMASINTSCTPLTPITENIIRKRFNKALEMNVKQLNRFEHEVTSKGNDVIVDFGQRQCSCHVFDLDKLP
uniref:Protein FAR1-RELATED SEQUENCE n=1 Tax=Cannabis sativa TaxID=3483 RepID=A0A803Q336_CANSA